MPVPAARPGSASPPPAASAPRVVDPSKVVVNRTFNGRDEAEAKANAVKELTRAGYKNAQALKATKVDNLWSVATQVDA